MAWLFKWIVCQEYDSYENKSFTFSEKYMQEIRQMAMSQLLVVFKNGPKCTD